MTCESCEQKHEDNDSTPPCMTGKYDYVERDPKWPGWIDATRCPERRVVLLPANRIAWDLYWTARSPIGQLLADLDVRQMTKMQADDLAIRLRIIANAVADEEHEMLEEQKNKVDRDAERARRKRR